MLCGCSKPVLLECAQGANLNRPPSGRHLLRWSAPNTTRHRSRRKTATNSPAAIIPKGPLGGRCRDCGRTCRSVVADSLRCAHCHAPSRIAKRPTDPDRAMTTRDCPRLHPFPEDSSVSRGLPAYRTFLHHPSMNARHTASGLMRGLATQVHPSLGGESEEGGMGEGRLRGRYRVPESVWRRSLPVSGFRGRAVRSSSGRAAPPAACGGGFGHNANRPPVVFYRVVATPSHWRGKIPGFTVVQDMVHPVFTFSIPLFTSNVRNSFADKYLWFDSV